MNIYKPAQWGLLCLLLLLGACQSGPDKIKRPFSLSSVGKSDVDMVADIRIEFLMKHLERLMEKLYLRNPREWKKGPHGSAKQAVRYYFNEPGRLLQETFKQRGADEIYLAFDPNYSGDRVLAFVAGLTHMTLDSYNGLQEFYLMDTLDPQKLYNCARNYEIASWKLRNDRQLNGQMFLLSNEPEGPVPNTSFERLFGKMIALQDSMARIVADSSNRRIKNVMQRMASVLFLPI